MRKLLLMAVFAFSALLSNAQIIGNYQMSYFDKEYKVEVSKKSVIVGIAGEFKTREYGFLIDRENVKEFKLFLENLKSKFIEYKNIAEQNNVVELDKDLPFKSPKMDVYWIGSDVFFSFSQYYQPRFKVFSSGKYGIVLHKKVKSSSNEYIDTDTYIVFINEEEIQDLINLLDEDKLNNFLKNIEKKDDLFK